MKNYTKIQTIIDGEDETSAKLIDGVYTLTESDLLSSDINDKYNNKSLYLQCEKELTLFLLKDIIQETQYDLKHDAYKKHRYSIYFNGFGKKLELVKLLVRRDDFAVTMPKYNIYNLGDKNKHGGQFTFSIFKDGKQLKPKVWGVELMWTSYI